MSEILTSKNFFCSFFKMSPLPPAPTPPFPYIPPNYPLHSAIDAGFVRFRSATLSATNHIEPLHDTLRSVQRSCVPIIHLLRNRANSGRNYRRNRQIRIPERSFLPFSVVLALIVRGSSICASWRTVIRAKYKRKTYLYK